MAQYFDTSIEDAGNSLCTLAAITDIAHIRHTGEAMMTIRDIENNARTSIRCHDEGELAEDTVGHRVITPREQEVFKLIASGLISKQVAEQLGVSIHTVNNQKQSLLRKSRTKSMAELASYGVMMGHLTW